MINEDIFNQILTVARAQQCGFTPMSTQEFFNTKVNPTLLHFLKMELNKVSSTFREYLMLTIATHLNTSEEA